MVEHNADIIIFGAGIAGLWTADTLRKQGYNVLLLEKHMIGSGQSMASQGIIHSGLKYTLTGKMNQLAENISAMPDRWRSTFGDHCTAAPSQSLFIPGGFIGGIAGFIARKRLAHTRLVEHLPAEIRQSGFRGSIIAMDEPVLDIPQVLATLSRDNAHIIRKLPGHPTFVQRDNGHIDYITLGPDRIRAKYFIFSAGAKNATFARRLEHHVETQKRPLLMGLMKNAPFPLYAHFIGRSDKPVATITTHTAKDGTLVWYIGGRVAERSKYAPPEKVYKAIRKAFKRYMPKLDLRDTEWAVYPVDRAEKKTGEGIPSGPAVERENNALYCWPTKLTFAPLLADMILQQIGDIHPSGGTSDWSFLPEADFAETPWDKAIWTKRN
jgi:hypothetical protein